MEETWIIIIYILSYIICIDNASGNCSFVCSSPTLHNLTQICTLSNSASSCVSYLYLPPHPLFLMLNQLNCVNVWEYFRILMRSRCSRADLFPPCCSMIVSCSTRPLSALYLCCCLAHILLGLLDYGENHNYFTWLLFEFWFETIINVWKKNSLAFINICAYRNDWICHLKTSCSWYFLIGQKLHILVFLLNLLSFALLLGLPPAVKCIQLPLSEQYYLPFILHQCLKEHGNQTGNLQLIGATCSGLKNTWASWNYILLPHFVLHRSFSYCKWTK